MHWKTAIQIIIKVIKFRNGSGQMGGLTETQQRKENLYNIYIYIVKVTLLRWSIKFIIRGVRKPMIEKK